MESRGEDVRAHLCLEFKFVVLAMFITVDHFIEIVSWIATQQEESLLPFSAALQIHQEQTILGTQLRFDNIVEV